MHTFLNRVPGSIEESMNDAIVTVADAKDTFDLNTALTGKDIQIATGLLTL